MKGRLKLASLGMALAAGASIASAAGQIDGGLFVARGANVRSLTREVVIEAPVKEVYAAWTTGEGWSKVYGQPSKANIELAIGGPYEWLFDGAVGSNGCQVLAFIPDRMLSFSWNAPTSQPESRALRTWVVVETESLDAGRTRVRITHLGFGNGENWDETYAYFDAAWDRVLARFQDSLGRE